MCLEDTAISSDSNVWSYAVALGLVDLKEKNKCEEILDIFVLFKKFKIFLLREPRPATGPREAFPVQSSAPLPLGEAWPAT